MPPVSRFYMQSVNINVWKSEVIVCSGQLTSILFVGRRINDAQGCLLDRCLHVAGVTSANWL